MVGPEILWSIYCWSTVQYVRKLVLLFCCVNIPTVKLIDMANSSRQTRLRSKKFNENITKRGKVATEVNNNPTRTTENSTVSPILLGFLFFILVGR